MNWFLLTLGGLFEACFTFCMGKMSRASGTEWWLWLLGFIVSVSLSMGLLAKAAHTIPIGTAYPVWTGIGAVGSVIIGIAVFHEPLTAGRMFFTFTLIASVVGLKMV